MQDKRTKTGSIDPKVYYSHLSKKEKGTLLHYMSVRYGLNTQTLLRKLGGALPMKPMEEETVTRVIEEGLWRG